MSHSPRAAMPSMRSPARTRSSGAIAAMRRGAKSGSRIRRNRAWSGGSNAIGTRRSGLPSASNAWADENTSGCFNVYSTASGPVANQAPLTVNTSPSARIAAHPSARLRCIGSQSSVVVSFSLMVMAGPPVSASSHAHGVASALGAG